jgi:hypothetical protein
MSSFLSEPGPLVRADPARARIEPDRAGLGLDPNNRLRARLAGLVLIDHLYCIISFVAASSRARAKNTTNIKKVSACHDQVKRVCIVLGLLN